MAGLFDDLLADEQPAAVDQAPALQEPAVAPPQPAGGGLFDDIVGAPEQPDQTGLFDDITGPVFAPAENLGARTIQSFTDAVGRPQPGQPPRLGAGPQPGQPQSGGVINDLVSQGVEMLRNPGTSDEWYRALKGFFPTVTGRMKLAFGGFQQLFEQAPVGVLDPEGVPYPERTYELMKAAREQAVAHPESTIGGQISAAAMEDLKANDPHLDPLSAPGIVFNATTSAVPMFIGVLGSIATRNPYVGLAVMGAEVGGMQYAESVAAGRTPEQALLDAAFMTSAELIGEKIPLDIIIKPGGKFFARTFKAAGAEGLQEVFTEIMQTGYSMGILNEDMTWGEAVRAVIAAGLTGGLMGGTVAALTHPLVGGEPADAGQPLPEGAPEGRTAAPPPEATEPPTNLPIPRPRPRGAGEPPEEPTGPEWEPLYDDESDQQIGWYNKKTGETRRADLSQPPDEADEQASLEEDQARRMQQREGEGPVEPPKTPEQFLTPIAEGEAAGEDIMEPTTDELVQMEADRAEEADRLVLETGARLKSKSGRHLAPVPQVDATSERKTGNTIARIDEWLHSEALKEAEGEDYLTTLIKAMDPKQLSPADRTSLNEILFDDPEGASGFNVIGPDEFIPEEGWDRSLYTAREAAKGLGIEWQGTKLSDLKAAIQAVLDARKPAAPEGTPAAPVVEPQTAEDIQPARDQVDIDPTDAQRESGRYGKGRVILHGLSVDIETPKGAERQGPKDESGKPAWVNVNDLADYGDILRTKAADGDRVDVYIGPNPQSTKIFVIDQYRPDTGKFDEHKAVMGADSAEQARDIYDAGFSDKSGPKRRLGVTEMSVDEFKTWLKEGDTTKAVAPLQKEPETQPEPTPEPEPQQPEAEWYRTLSDKARESLFAEMRRLGERAQEHWKKAQELTAPTGTIAVGGAYFDDQLKAAAIDSYLRAIRKGSTPEQALEATEKERTGLVQKFNARTKDYMIQRAETAEQTFIEDIHRAILLAAKEPEAEPPPTKKPPKEPATDRRKPMPKMQDVGEAMAGKRAEATKRIAKTEGEKGLEKLLEQTRESTDFRSRLAEDATSGAHVFALSMNREFDSFLEQQGKQAGGTRKKWGEPYSVALKQRWQDMPDKVRSNAADYIATMETIGDAIAGAKNVAEVRKALEDLLVAEVMLWDDGSLKRIVDTEFGKQVKNSYLRDYRWPWRWKLGETKGLQYGIKDEDKVPDKKTPLIRPSLPVEDIQRQGLPERRKKSANIKAEDFRSTFGFRGVEFGNWVTGREGQIHVNAAYDALLDFAEALNIPPKAISLGGRLGLAFGSRGKGRHAAHFEPGNFVINLTKTRGDGSVAHEWGHALDYYLRESGETRPTAVKHPDRPERWALQYPDGSYALNARDAPADWDSKESAERYGIPSHRKILNQSALALLQAIRDSLTFTWDAEAALKQLDAILKGWSYISGQKSLGPVKTAKRYVDDLWQRPGWHARRETNYKDEADKLGKGYWGNPEELWARSFESFVYDEMAAKGQVSPYLVNEWVSEGYASEESGYRGKPYPAEAERQNFALVWRNLFSQLEFGEDGKLKPKTYTAPPSGKQAVADALAKVDIEARWAELEKEKRRAREPGQVPEAGQGPSPPVPPQGVPPTEGEGGTGEGGVEPGDGDSGRGEQSTTASEPGRAPGAEDEDGAKLPPDGGERRPEGGAAPGRGDGLENRPERSVRGLNFRIAEDKNYATGSAKERIAKNIDAIRVALDLERGGQFASKEDQEQLAPYVGWGATELSKVFDEGRGADVTLTEARNALKQLLTPEQYQSAKATVTNAHYTSQDVVRGMWDAMKALGFSGDGTVLEPGMGIGNFMGMRPEGVEPKFVGVELDDITGKIGRALYPQAKVMVTGFERANLPPDSFDAVIGNVPFSRDYKPFDKLYNKAKLSLHNYFLFKSINLLKPGGVMAVVSSRYTMDANDSTARKMFYEAGADLVGAIRLPNTAFKQNAGTTVTTDILFFRKRKPGEQPGADTWLKTKEIELVGGKAEVNAYFAKNPKMILGEQMLTRGQFTATDYAVVGVAQDLRQRIATAVKRMAGQSPLRFNAEANAQSNPIDDQFDDLAAPPEYLKDGAFFERDGKVYRKEMGRTTEPEMTDGQRDRVRQLIKLRDKAREILNAQRTWDGTGAEPWRPMQKELTKLHDAFVKKFEFINKVNITRYEKDGETIEQRRYPNLTAFRDDPDAPLVMALEVYNEEANTGAKSAIFTQRVLEPTREITKVETPKEALIASLNMKGGVDLAYMAKILDRPIMGLSKDLEGLIYKNPASGVWELAELYLAGNVRAKLAIAKLAAKTDEIYKANAEALEKVQPEDLKPSQIGVRMGAPWIPNTDIEDFVTELLGSKAVVEYVAKEAVWTVRVADDRTAANTQTWAVKWQSRGSWFKDNVVKDGLDLVSDVLNQRTTKIQWSERQPDGSSKTFSDVGAMILAQEKQDAIKERFQQWLWSDQERGARLSRFYNDTFNNLRIPVFNGDHLTLPGSSTKIELRTTQKKAVWRFLVAGNELLDHVVGAGKTYTAIAAAMESKRLGLLNKPLFSVPNHMLEQFSREFVQMYPNANLLIADERNFAGDNRRRFVGRAAAGNWDAIIMTHSSFERVGMSNAFQEQFIRDEVAEYEALIKEERARDKSRRGGKEQNLTVKKLEAAKKSRETKLNALLLAKDKDRGLSFEDLGVDGLFIDEAHLFKNLDFASKMENIGPSKPSQRASDLYLKTRYIDSITPGRGVMFMTGTPISNSMSEAFTMQRYLAPRLLAERGVSHFDAWASIFGDTVTKAELAPEGGRARLKTRFAKFRNIPEMIQMYRQFADFVTKQDLLDTGVIKLPKVQDGKARTIEIEGSQALLDYVREIGERADAVRAREVSPDEDNMLKISSDGRKASLDMRLVDPKARPEPKRKAVAVAENVAEIYHSTAPQRSTQLIFADMAVPNNKGTYSVYDDIRDELIKRKVKPAEIAFIHDADTDTKKARMFSDVREGKVRVLLGSTEKMGIGTNVQRRLIALHHLDPLWKPADMEQREGRIERQGNENEEIQINRYVTVGSFDAYMYQTMERKASFIGQVKSGDLTVREMEDIGDNVLSYAEAKALAAGNPLILEKAKIDNDVDRLRRLRNAHFDDVTQMQWKLQRIPEDIGSHERQLEKLRADQKTFEENFRKAPFVIGGKTFEYGGKDNPRPKAEKALGEFLMVVHQRALKAMEAEQAQWGTLKKVIRLETPLTGDIGSAHGFKLRYYANGDGSPDIDIMGKAERRAYTDLATLETGSLDRVENELRRTAAIIAEREAEVARLQKQQTDFKELVKVPFARTDELTQALKRQRKIDIALGLTEPTLEDQVAAIEDKMADLEARFQAGGLTRAKYLEEKRALEKERAKLSGETVSDEWQKRRVQKPRPQKFDPKEQPWKEQPWKESPWTIEDLMPQKQAVGETETVGVGADLKRLIDLFGPKMYGANMPQVTAKELMQNSFDAIKAAYRRGNIKPGEGKITVTYNRDARLLAFEDNGAGMSPETVKDAFLTIAGTNKDDLAEWERSGGFGVAKLAFIFGNEELTLITVRDGVKTSMLTTGKKLLDGKATLKTEHTSDPPGTFVQVTFPEKVRDNKGEMVKTSLPYWARGAFDIFDKPLIGDVEVELRDMTQGSPEKVVLPLGRHQTLSATPKVSTAHFPWGEIDIYMGERDPRGRYGKKTVLSSGLFQFNVSISKQLHSWDELPYDIIFDVKPRVEAADPAYPFNNQREDWSPKIKSDINQLYAFLQMKNAAVEARGVGGTFARVLEMPIVAEKKLRRGETVEFGEVGLERRLPKPPEFEIDSEITIRDGKTYIGGVQTDKEAELKQSQAISLQDFQLPEEDVPDDLPYFHNNLNVDVINALQDSPLNVSDLTEVRQFFARIGSIMLEFRDRLASVPGVYGMWATTGHPVGISLDKTYHGVHVKVPYRGFFLNPISVGLDIAESDEAVAASWLHTLFHEAVHTLVDGHGESFTTELAKLETKFAQAHPGMKRQIEDALISVVRDHRRVFDYLRRIYNDPATANVAEPGGGERAVVEPGEPAWLPGQPSGARAIEPGAIGPAGRDQPSAAEGEVRLDVSGPDVRAQVAPIYYSALEREIANAKQAKAPASQWSAFINNAAARGVTKDEVDWAGVREWLGAQQKPVTKEDLIAFLRENGVRVQEVKKGGGRRVESSEYPADIDAWEPVSDDVEPAGSDGTVRESTRRAADAELTFVHRAADGVLMFVRMKVGDETLGDASDFIEAREHILRFKQQEGVDGGVTKFEQFTLPGGEDYTELLLTLPPKPKDALVYPEPATELPDGYEPIIDDNQPAGSRWGVTPPGQGSARPWAGRHPTKEAALAAALKLYNENRNENAAHEWRKRNEGRDFQSGHFDEPNIVAHIRFKTRIDADGKRVLAIEEIQSDWHQQGRKRGYGDARPVQPYIVRLGDQVIGRFNTEAEALAAREAAGSRATAHRLPPGGKTGVPDAPFKTTWHELALKRMLRYAAENGYDRIAWTTGEQQAERYNLSRHMQAVEVERTPRGQFKITATLHNGRKERLEADNLADAVGAELAERINKDMQDRALSGREDFKKTYSGLDLKLGGEGMKGFYDKIVPQFLNKYAKKWGAQVGTTTVGEARDVPEDRVEEIENLDGSGVHYIAYGPDGRRTGPAYDTREEAEVAAGATRHLILHSLDVTPSMRESVMRGQPLFRIEETARDWPPKKPVPIQGLQLTVPTDKEQTLVSEVQAIVQKLSPSAPLDIFRRVKAGDQTLMGFYDELRKTIVVGLQDNKSRLRSADQVVATTAHEVLHFLRRTGLITDKEWETLEQAAAERGWIKHYQIDTRYPNASPELKLEEAVAEAFGEGYADRWSKEKGPVVRIFAKIDRFLREAAAAFRRIMGKDATADDLFLKFESGEFGRRQPVGQPLTAAEGVLAQAPGLKAIEGGGLGSEEQYWQIVGKVEGDHGKVIAKRAEKLFEKYKNVEAWGQELVRRGWLDTIPPAPRPSLSILAQVPPLTPFQQYTDRPQPGVVAYLRDSNLSLMQKLKGATSLAAINKSLDDIRVGFQHRFLRVSRVQSVIERTLGRPLTEDENAHLAEELSSGKKGARIEDLFEKRVRPLIIAMNELGISREDLEAFLYARHAPERNARIQSINPRFVEEGIPGSGMSDEDAAAILQAVDDSGRRADYDALASMVDQILAFAVDTRVEAGLLSEEQAEAWRSTYQNYVPLKGEFDLDPELEADRPRSGRGFDVKGRESYRAFGRSTPARDILAYSIMQAEEAIIRGENNAIGNAILALAEAAPNTDFWRVDKITVKPYWIKAREEVEYRAERRMLPEDTDYTISTKVDGEERRITFNRKNPVAREMAESFKGLGSDQIHPAIRYIGQVNRWLSHVNTTLNPEFWITNAFRDAQTALANLQQFDVAGITKGTVKDYRKALVASSRSAFQAGAESMMTPWRASDQAEWDRWATEFRANGGRVYFNQMDDVLELRKRLDREMRALSQPGYHPLKALKTIGGWIEKMNISVENAIRLSAYKNARERGMTPAQAASLAKNLTVNFNRRGAWGPLMNALYLFYNASVQGTFTLLTAWKSPRVRKVAGAAVVMGVLLEVLNTMLSGEDDDGELYYDKITPYDKSRNLIVMNPAGTDHNLKIPLPYGYSTFFALGRSMAEIARGKDWMDVTGNFLVSVLESFNPIGGATNIYNMVAPTVFDPFFDLGMNRDFAGRPIAPSQNQYGPQIPSSQRYWNSTSPAWRSVTDFLSQATGGTGVEPGLIEISPEWLDYMLGTTLGAAGQFWERSFLDFPMKLIDPTSDVLMSDIPVVRRVVGRTPPWVDKENFYERINEIEQARSYANQYQRQNRRPEARDFTRLNQRLLGLYGASQNAREHLSAVRSSRASTALQLEQGRITRQQYNERMRILGEDEDRAIREFNSVYVDRVIRRP